MWLVIRALDVCLTTYALFCIFTVAATTEIYTLSLHDAFRSAKNNEVLLGDGDETAVFSASSVTMQMATPKRDILDVNRSEEHTSELQSRENLVCRLLLEKKNTNAATLKHIQRPRS